ncbi:MAG: hypothetical protein IT480_13900 [Gammaproteobacteria bacterium]|nr:hypothetical protein [Gammaproteobacteria bacterium]
MFKSTLVVMTLAATGFGCGAAAQPPAATIRNGQLTATVYLPDAQRGFYRGTRFDWSGIVASLTFKGHDYIGTWYQGTSPDVLDHEYRGDRIVTGPATSMIGVAEVFNTSPSKFPLGWEAAPVGGHFVKIGVGVLRKTDNEAYSQFKPYPIVDGGRWRVRRTARSIEFTQTVRDRPSGYAYVYTKRVTLASGKPRMTLAHALRNTGNQPIRGMVYNHNFMRWDNEVPNPDYQVKFAFDPTVKEIPAGMPISLGARTFSFTRTLIDRDAIRLTPGGFGPAASDYDFRVENRKLGIGLRMTADRPLAQLALWGIRTVFAVEPFISYDIPPGATFSWTLDYDAYALQ